MLRFRNIAMLSAVLAFSIAQAWATMVTFQVNMSVQAALGNFAPGTDSVVVRGEFNGWGGNTHMVIAQGEGIYVGTFDIPARPDTAYPYKFVMITMATPNGDWEADPNREVVVGNDPITLPVVFFSELSSAGSADVEINFRVDMTLQLLNGNFDPATDWIVVRGGHANIGSWGGAVVRLSEVTGSEGIYSAWVQFDSLSTVQPLEYKFVVCHDFNESDDTGWEQRPGGNRSILPTGEETDLLPLPNGNGYGEIVPEIVYFADATPDDILTQEVAVTFQVEITPLIGRFADVGYVVDAVSGDTIRALESIEVAGATPPFPANWPWGNFPESMRLNDNGTGGDVTAGDHVYSVTLTFPAGTAKLLEYKYGCNGADAEAGFARNHYRRIDDSAPTDLLDIDCWGSPDELFAQWPCTISGVEEPSTPVISDFSLAQNYPNPFNPTTTINFTLSQANVTTLKVFDVLGRAAGVINMGRMEAGRHSMSFDGSKLASGVYFYQLESGAFQATRKMLLLK